MVPVELRLNNFMSYGTHAPSLDFGLFHVACLSGRNGQGKSALLDAITWSLWGEARKSSGSHKPDDELIRIGTRDMEVELVFDVEGERYRVTRSYARSATGKTSRAQLELHLYDRETSSYRPLTGATMRETQELVSNVVGIDYDTFINSAFLLQGRSDEFTKRKPGERKEILGRILNLSRYARLEEMARDRERAARARLERLDHETERLKAAVADEPLWKEERDEARTAAAEAQAGLEALRKEERRLTEQLADLDAKTREAASIRRSLESVAQRRSQLEADAEGLKGRIAEAEALIERSEQIQKDYERYEKLLRERDDLDTKRDLHRGIEKQIEGREKELNDRRTELEKRLHALEVEQKAHRTALNECAARLAEAPALRRALEKAGASRRKMEAMSATLRERRGLEEEVERVERELLGQREALSGQLKTLSDQIRREAQALPDLEKLRRRRDELHASCEALDGLKAKLEETRWQGQELAEMLKEQSGQLSAWEAERQDHQENLDRLLEAEGGACPTCGSELTPAHRTRVEADYRRLLEVLDGRVARTRRTMKEQAAKRDALRAAYRDLQEQIAELAGVAERHAAVEAEIQRADEAAAALEEKRQAAAALKLRIEQKKYGDAPRERLQALKKRLEALPFDEKTYEALREEAAQVGSIENRLRELEEVAGRQEQLEKVAERQERQIEELRAQLDSGSGFRTLQEQIAAYRRQLEEIGFAPARFDEVRREVRTLEKAGERLKDLVNAQQNQASWREQLDGTRERLEALGVERGALSTKLAGIEEALERRSALEAEQREKAEACRGVERELQALQLRLGEVNARLEQAKRDREALRQARKDHAAARAERALYRQLRAAFGKHGIPSLIIENTLPEIEERANTLLDRLTDGRMHVRLETLKDKRTGGGTKETLEIIITDEQGVPRPYETFSGGEAFRVNFALRISLAQLLAERSGVRIRTLVIDEGFGTQDAQGVQNMVEAIQVIQDDFDKIVVITHLQELKEAFPVRIEVVKDPVEGSNFEVIGV